MSLFVSHSTKSDSVAINTVNAQNWSLAEMEQTKSTQNDTGSTLLLVTKVVRCVSELGIPSDEAVCKFVLDNVLPSQFTMTVTGNKSNPPSFQGTVNGTIVSIHLGNYTVTENLFDTRNIENLLGETTTGSVSTIVLGDCIGQSNYMGVFQNATGTIASGDGQKCEITNTIEITSGETS
ncbi:MAG: hypothetical protein WKF36_03660 [Candidatus Nitrosocosmicus sp.]